LLAATKKTHIFNLDDENVGYFLKFSAKEKLGYSFGSRKENIKTLTAENLKTAPNISFQIEGVFFNLGLIGGFNAYNALAAILIGASQGVKLEICKKALEKIKTMPGRMEVVAERPFKVIVDLAHTPDSFEEVFRAVKNMPHNKIISVFGAAGGGRAKWKRPVLGKIAAQHSDFIILTNEDPYDESPADIIKQIAAGIEDISINQHSNQHKSAVLKILDRREAIRAGLKMAGENDIVLILGKGTEQLMVIGGKKIPWDDRNVVREELGRR
jgi:UDP-N-acetylmuramoyl-L-alanyl-D-glutamate--2,6-diaminopimelate ligase